MWWERRVQKFWPKFRSEKIYIAYGFELFNKKKWDLSVFLFFLVQKMGAAVRVMQTRTVSTGEARRRWKTKVFVEIMIWHLRLPEHPHVVRFPSEGDRSGPSRGGASSWQLLGQIHPGPHSLSVFDPLQMVRTKKALHWSPRRSLKITTSFSKQTTRPRKS